MSLVEAERAWLKGKASADYPAPCVRYRKRGLFSMRYCLTSPCDYNRSGSPIFCPLASDYRDAAEFEARVAVKLVGELQYECVCPSCQYNTHGCRTVRMSYNQCRLKHARLAVESEMEMEKKQ